MNNQVDNPLDNDETKNARIERGFPLLDKNGQIRIETVNALSFEQLRNWIRNVLQGEDPGAGIERDELPYGFLKRVYRRLAPRVKESFEEAVLEHLAEFARTKKAMWTGESPHQLMLLVAALFRDSRRSKAPVDLLLYIAKQKQFIEAQVPNLNWRALQTLVSLRYRASPDFWYEQFRNFRYALVVFAGLSIRSFPSAMRWVRNQLSSGDELNNDAVVDALVTRLPLLVEDYGSTMIEQHLLLLSSFLSELQMKKLRALAERLGLELPGGPRTPMMKAMTGKELSVLRRPLGIRFPTKATISIKQGLVENQLVELGSRWRPLQSSTIDSKVIFGMESLRHEKKVKLPISILAKISDHGRTVVERATSLEDGYTLAYSLALTIGSQRDVNSDMRDIVRSVRKAEWASSRWA